MTARKTLQKAQQGFTLIELLVVIGILAVLLAITLIAINPASQFAKANNTKRRSDVNAILNAVNQYMADNKGVLPTGIATTVRTVSNTGADLCTVLVPKYIAALPVDPQTGNGQPVTDCAAAYNTNYQIIQSTSDSRITVTAPGAELTETIAVTR
jgi:prepilin-type N-terminal cleavage/methylation domain-containing protein